MSDLGFSFTGATARLERGGHSFSAKGRRVRAVHARTSAESLRCGGRRGVLGMLDVDVVREA